MSSLMLLFPLAALAYFLWRATKSRIFLLGIPFLQFFRQSVFFEDVRVFWIPGRLSTVTITMLWLILVWALCTDRLLPSRRQVAGERVQPFGPRPLPEELLLVVVAVVAAASMLVTAARNIDLTSALGEASGVVFMLLGYLFVRGIVSHSDRDELMRFVQAIVVVNTVAAALFVIHQGLHIPVYGAAEYYETVFQGQVITRTFVFMSPLLFFALAYAFAKRRWTVWTYLIIAVNLVAIWVSYTRTMLAMAAVIAAISVLARLLKRGQEMLALRRALAVGAVVVAMGVALVTLLPTESNYFVGRIQRMLEGGGVARTESFVDRSVRLATTVDMVAAQDFLLGFGFETAEQDPLYETVRQWSWDSAWITILYRMGFAGAVAFGAVLLAYAARAFWLFIRRDPWSEEYGLMWFTFIVATAISSFIGWAFMDQSRYPMNLWFLAFLAAGVLLPRVTAQHAADAKAAAGSAAGAAREKAAAGETSRRAAGGPVPSDPGGERRD
jgi:hypothetical protein